MSDNTQGSGSSRKSFRRGVPVGGSGAAESIKNSLSHLSGSISRGVEAFKGKGSPFLSKVGSKDTSVFSKGVRELDNYGYERFNIGDQHEVYISRLSASAFDDDLLVRATEGNFVGPADPVKVKVPVEETVAKEPTDARSFFKNVPLGRTPESEYRATIGVNNNGRIEQTVDNSFLDKMTRSANVRNTPVVGYTSDDDEVIIQSAPEDTSDANPTVIEDTTEAPVETPVVETPVEDTIETPRQEFSIDVNEGSSDTFQEEIVETPVEDTIEVPEVIETPVEAPVVEEAIETPRQEFFIEASEETSETFQEETIEAPVEDVPDIVETPVETPVEIPEVIETPVEAPVEDVPVVVEASIPKTVEAPAGEIDGLKCVAGHEPSSVAEVAVENVASNVNATTAETSNAATAKPVPARFGIEADGEALPPMSDPVVTRPRSVRFRFTNGVLMNVDKTEESKEGLRRPLE